MDYSILVNKDNPLPRASITNTLENVHSEYKENILLDNKDLEAFQELKREALRYGYHIDIVSGYRDYDYQEKIYNKLLEEKGFTYAITRIASPGKSEHQTGLALDFCIISNILSDSSPLKLRIVVFTSIIAFTFSGVVIIKSPSLNNKG